MKITLSYCISARICNVEGGMLKWRKIKFTYVIWWTVSCINHVSTFIVSSFTLIILVVRVKAWVKKDKSLYRVEKTKSCTKWTKEPDFKTIETSSSSIFHGVGPLVDPFRSHASRSLFNGPPWFLLPVGEYCFITLGNLLRGILFTWCIQFLLYSCSLSIIGVIFNSFAICVFVLWSVQVYPAVLLMYFISAAVILQASLALMVQESRHECGNIVTLGTDRFYPPGNVPGTLLC